MATPIPTAHSFPKEELRRELRRRRKELSAEERQRLSRSAADGIIAAAVWRQAETVALYMSVRGEIDTTPLLAHAWDSGKLVLLPACSRKEQGKMCLVACSGADGLCTGSFGIPEPPLSEEETEFHELYTDDCGNSDTPDAADKGIRPVPDIIVVPGLAFDRKGARLGMGGGYYDRLLALPRYRNSLRLGLAYSFQLVDSLPREDWDVPVHAVCTEQGMLWIHDTLPLSAT